MSSSRGVALPDRSAAPRRRRSSGIDVLTPHLRSCIAVVGEPKLLNLREPRYTVGRCRSSNLAHQARSGKDRSIKGCGQRSCYTSASKSGSGWGLLSVWVDRQWSNKLECYVAQARRVVMAYGLAGAHREELKDKQLPSLRTELRSNRSGKRKAMIRCCAILPASVSFPWRPRSRAAFFSSTR